MVIKAAATSTLHKPIKDVGAPASFTGTIMPPTGAFPAAPNTVPVKSDRLGIVSALISPKYNFIEHFPYIIVNYI